MNKLIWVLACLLIADWLFDFQMTQIKINEYKKITGELKEELQAIKSEVDEIKLLQQIIQPDMKDPQNWTRSIEQLNILNNPVLPPQ